MGSAGIKSASRKELTHGNRSSASSIPHLVVDDAAAAIDFYVKAFDAEESAGCPGRTEKLIHAALRINGAW